jgi:hypothetical protein
MFSLGACSPDAQQAPKPTATQPVSNTTVVAVPCFEDAGEPVLRVAGIGVPAQSIERYAALLARKYPGMSQDTLRMRTIEDVIVPLAALYAQHAADIPRMSLRARGAADRLARGDAFEAVAADVGDDLSARQGGAYGTVTRTKDSLANLPEPMEIAVFAAKAGAVVGPFASKVGFQFVKVDKVNASPDGGTEQREVRQILIHYDAEMAQRMREVDIKRADLKDLVDGWQAAFTNASRQAIEAAPVEVLDPSWGRFVYPYRIKTKN